MLRGVNHNFYDFAEHPFCGFTINPRQRNDAIDEAICGSDEFRMYAYKIKRCSRTRSHDWTECPYAHRGEKAQRRDPRKMPYCAIACPAFRNGRCIKGDACEFAHGVFEYWLHPARYRTRACNAGRFCQRKVCFFAHTPDQLRPEGKHKCHFAFRAKMNVGDHVMMGGGSGSSSAEHATSALKPASPSPSTKRSGEKYCLEGVTEILRSLRGLKIRDNLVEEGKKSGVGDGGFESSDFDFDLGLPNIDWIAELVQ